MEANPYSLKQILSPERRYIVPTFQRDYEWTRDGQWQLLFDDLEQVAERLQVARSMSEASGKDPALGDKRVGPHFLGAIVLDQLPSAAGAMDVRAVIDGQQRLTTVQLLLRGLLDILVERGSGRQKQVRRLLENPADIVDGDERHKLWPRRRDRDIWRATMADQPPSDKHAYPDARRYFSSRAREFVADGAAADTRAALLVDAALDLFRLVVIDLEENDDAQVIFEVLNGRQTPLSAADLVKNLLFLRAEEAHEGHLEELYERYWAPFDDPWWKTEVGRGHAARRHTDMLLAAWLTATSGEDASPGRLYGQIRGHLNATDEAVEVTLRQISQFAHEYQVINGRLVEPVARIRSAYARLNLLGVTTALPLLLWLRAPSEVSLPPPGHLASVLAVESFILRRSLIGAQTRGYGQIFAEVLGRAKAAAVAGDDVTDAIRVALASNTQSRGWPTDAEIQQAFLTRRFYGVDSPQRIRLLLGAIDVRLRSKKPMTESATFDYVSLTVEHIMPQSWETHWPLPPTASDADRLLAGQRRSQAVDQIGNLTLVTHSLNPSLSNAGWTDKRAALIESSDLVLNSEITAMTGWDETAIQARATRLASLAVEEWPGPPIQSLE